METQFSVCQLSSTASNSLLSPHSHGVPASFNSHTCTILSSHTGMATALDVQPWLQCLHSHIPHWLPPAHTHDSPLLHSTWHHVQQQQLKETMATTRNTNSHNHSNFLDNNFCLLLHNTSHCGVYSQNLRVNHCLHRLLNSPTRSLDSVVSLVTNRNTMLATLHWGGPEFSCCVLIFLHQTISALP